MCGRASETEGESGARRLNQRCAGCVICHVSCVIELNEMCKRFFVINFTIKQTAKNKQGKKNNRKQAHQKI